MLWHIVSKERFIVAPRAVYVIAILEIKIYLIIIVEIHLMIAMQCNIKTSKHKTVMV